MSIHSTPVAIKKWRARTELYGASAEEWLRRWDAGETCWTLEMGGLGPGYEQAIQILVAEIVRDYLGKPMPGWGEKFGDWGDATVSRIDARDPETGKYAMGGFSGAQVGAAKWLAWWFLMDSPASIILAAERHGDKDRSMIVSKNYPKAPDAKAAA